MNAASTVVFRENRAKFPLEELQKYRGQWVAFSSDARYIVAGASSMADLFDHLRAANEDIQSLALEHIMDDSDEIYLGGAELQ
jgi:hypothetical protein